MKVHMMTVIAMFFLLSTAPVLSGETQQCGPKGCPVSGQPSYGQVNKQVSRQPTVEEFYGITPDAALQTAGNRQNPQATKPATPSATKGPQAAKPVTTGASEGQQKVPIPNKAAYLSQRTRNPQQKHPISSADAPTSQMFAEYSGPPVPVPDGPLAAAQRILPEVASQIQLSSSDVNRIVCPVDIKDIIFSKEKGITVKLAGSNAFVKFLVMKKDGKDLYASTPSEIFVVCGDDIYNIIAVPKRIPSQTIQLAPGKTDALKKNLALFGELPLEKKVVTILKHVYMDDIPDSITTYNVNRRFDAFKDINLVHYKTYVIDGEGLRVKEYRAVIEKGSPTDHVYLKEKDFLRTDLAQRPVAVSIDVLDLKKGGMSRVFIVERAEGDRT